MLREVFIKNTEVLRVGEKTKSTKPPCPMCGSTLVHGRCYNCGFCST